MFRYMKAILDMINDGGGVDKQALKMAFEKRWVIVGIFQKDRRARSGEVQECAYRRKKVRLVSIRKKKTKQNLLRVCSAIRAAPT